MNKIKDITPKEKGPKLYILKILISNSLRIKTVFIINPTPNPIIEKV